jgi:hypothetical protein
MVMQGLARGGAAIVGVFGLVLGLCFYVATEFAAAQFFVTPQGAAGLGTLRADMSAFFLVGAAFAFHGAWSGRAASLLVPLGLYAVALSGRALNLAANGPFEGALLPMVVEAALILILAFGYRTLRA